jgi:hypothetical protein
LLTQNAPYVRRCLVAQEFSRIIVLVYTEGRYIPQLTRSKMRPWYQSKKDIVNLPVCAKLYHPTAFVRVSEFYTWNEWGDIRSRYRQPGSFSIIVNRGWLLNGGGFFFFEALVETRGVLGSERLTAFGHGRETLGNMNKWNEILG